MSLLVLENQFPSGAGRDSGGPGLLGGAWPRRPPACLRGAQGQKGNVRTLTSDGGEVVKVGDALPIKWTMELRVVVGLERREAGKAPGGILDRTMSYVIVRAAAGAMEVRGGGSSHRAGWADERQSGRAAPMRGTHFKEAAVRSGGNATAVRRRGRKGLRASTLG